MVPLRVAASELPSEFRNRDDRSEGGAGSQNPIGWGIAAHSCLHGSCRVAAALLILMWATPALGQEPLRIGRVKVAEGAAFVVRDGRTIRAVQGDALRQSDALVTGPDGYIGATLQDDTRVVTGPRESPASGPLHLRAGNRAIRMRLDCGPGPRRIHLRANRTALP